MGCDIHIYAETFDGEKWNKVGRLFNNPFYSPEYETKTYEDGYISNSPLTDEPYKGRNYELFALLADVRNYYGISPIVEPRGVPDNASEEYKKIVESWGSDGHSHSYYTLRELLDFNWNFKFVVTAVISEAQRDEHLLNGVIPDSWCQWTNMQGYVQHSWEVESTNFFDWFLENTIPALQALGEPENVRIVFFFDN